MAIQFGTVDGLVNITNKSIQCFAKGIEEFVSQNGPYYAQQQGVSYGTAFQRFVDPVYNGTKTSYDVGSIKHPVKTKSGAEQSPARGTFCKKMGLLKIDESTDLFDITPLGKAIIDNDITIKEYAFILLSKMGVFKDGEYVDNLLSSIFKYFQYNPTISQNLLDEYIKSTYKDNSIVKTRSDIILNSLVVTGLLAKVTNDIYVLSGTGEAELFVDYNKRSYLLSEAKLDTSKEYSDYIGNLEYGGVFDILTTDNIDVYTKFFPNLFKYMKKSDVPLALQQIFYGAPGTGKSYEVKKQTGEWISENEERDLPNVFRTTFHPDTDYASFVGCYKPTMKPTSKEEKTLTGKDEEIVYEFVPQAFTDAYIYAYTHSTEQTYLVIEEINRGNCAQIFGDLFQLLDRKKDGVSEYKIKADKDLAKYLIDKLGEGSEGIKEGKLSLPANLNILATMNTSDQSLFPMDSAFKRRWEWEYVPINYGTDIKSGSFEIKIGEKAYLWVDFIEKANKKIFDLTQSEDKQLGNFFIKHSVDEKEFKSKVMFYLWYEVLRDETENNKYFFYKKTSVDEKDERSKFIFKDLYEEDSTQTLQQFMDYLGVSSK